MYSFDTVPIRYYIYYFALIGPISDSLCARIHCTHSGSSSILLKNKTYLLHLVSILQNDSDCLCS